MALRLFAFAGFGLERMFLNKPGAAAMTLLTPWANVKLGRLRVDLVTAEKRRKNLKRGRLHPSTRPIWVHALLLKFAFDPKRRAKTGLVRTLLALHGYTNDERQCFPSFKTIASAAGLDKRNARRHIGTLQSLGVIKDIQRQDKPGRQPGSKVPTSNLYTLWGNEDDGETYLIDLVLAAATGEMAIYALALRELRIGTTGVGAARLDRKKIRRALEQGIKKPDDSFVLDRRLTDESIVRHMDALREDKLLFKVGHARVTIKPALGAQRPVEGRLWDREDKGVKKSRRLVKSGLTRSSAPTLEKVSSAPIPSDLFRSFAPNPRDLDRSSAPRTSSLVQRPDNGVNGSVTTRANFFPPIGSGKPSPSPGISPPVFAKFASADAEPLAEPHQEGFIISGKSRKEAPDVQATLP